MQVTKLEFVPVPVVQVPVGVEFPIPSLSKLLGSVGNVLFGGRVKVQVVVVLAITVPGVCEPTPHVGFKDGRSDVVRGEEEKFIVAGEVDVVWLSPARVTFGKVTVELVGNTGLVILYWM